MTLDEYEKLLYARPQRPHKPLPNNLEIAVNFQEAQSSYGYGNGNGYGYGYGNGYGY